MADKEERILRGELRIQINQFLWPTCKECGNKCKDEETIKFCRDSQPGMTRQEAIEKMAKAMCHSPSGTCEDCFARESKKACKQAMFGMKELAEAALDALLEK